MTQTCNQRFELMQTSFARVNCATNMKMLASDSLLFLDYSRGVNV